MNTVIISAFPGTGKTTWFNKMKGSDIKVLDSDSSTFDKSDFPANYIRHIKSKMGEVDVIMVSSHQEVRDALVKAGIQFNFAYPKKSIKSEYLKRYEGRGSNEKFVELLTANWDNWITPLPKQKGCIHVELGAGEYLGDWLDKHVAFDYSF